MSGKARLPMDIAAHNGQIYYVDPYNKTVWHRSLAGKQENEEFRRFETIPHKLDISADAETFWSRTAKSFTVSRATITIIAQTRKRFGTCRAMA